jgi:hypothetical protein
MVKGFKFFSENHTVLTSLTDLVNKWQPTGMLDDAESPELVAHALETIYEYLVERPDSDSDFIINVYPIISRLYRNKTRYYFEDEIKRIVDRVIERLTYHLVTHRNPDLFFMANIDHEAEISFMIFEELNWEE